MKDTPKHTEKADNTKKSCHTYVILLTMYYVTPQVKRKLNKANPLKVNITIKKHSRNNTPSTVKFLKVKNVVVVKSKTRRIILATSPHMNRLTIINNTCTEDDSILLLGSFSSIVKNICTMLEKSTLKPP